MYRPFLNGQVLDGTSHCVFDRPTDVPPPLFIWCVTLVGDRGEVIDDLVLEFCQQMASLVFHNR